VQLTNEWKVQQSFVQLLLDAMICSKTGAAASAEIQRSAAAVSHTGGRGSLQSTTAAVSSSAGVARQLSSPSTACTDGPQACVAEIPEASRLLQPAELLAVANVQGVVGCEGDAPGTTAMCASNTSSHGTNLCTGAPGMHPNGIVASVAEGAGVGSGGHADIKRPADAKHASDVERFTILVRELLELTSENARLRRENMDLMREMREKALRTHGATPRAVLSGPPPAIGAFGVELGSTYNGPNAPPPPS